MSLADHIYNITLGVVMIAGLISVIYTLPKVAKWWKPLYWLAVPLAGLPILIVSVLVVDAIWHTSLIDRATLLILLKLVLFILGLQLIAVPFVHRLEERLLHRGPSDG